MKLHEVRRGLWWASSAQCSWIHIVTLAAIYSTGQRNKSQSKKTTEDPPPPVSSSCVWPSPGRAGPTFAGTSLFWGRTGRGWARRSLAWRTDGGWWRLWNPTPAPSCRRRQSGNVSTQDWTRRTEALQLVHELNLRCFTRFLFQEKRNHEKGCTKRPMYAEFQVRTNEQHFNEWFWWQNSETCQSQQRGREETSFGSSDSEQKNWASHLDPAYLWP